MKREEPLLHLRKHGCVMLREGGRQCWWHNPDRNRRSAAPRHREIHDQLAGKICRDLGVPPVKGF